MSISTRLNFDTGVNWEYDADDVEFVASKAQLKLQNDPSQLFPIDFSSDSGFTYNSSEVEFSGGKLQQKANDIVESYSQPFDSDAGFTYNSSYVEFAAGLARQKSQRLANATFGATYTTSINGSWGDGTLTGTATGGAAVVSNRLDLAHGDVRYVDYDAVGNAACQQTGAIKLKFTPNYSGAPASVRYLAYVEGVGGINKIQIYQVSTLLFWTIADSVGAGIVSVAESFTPVAGVTTEFELNWDLTTGATRMFKDGVQLGTTNTNTGTRTSATKLRIGSGAAGTSTSDHFIEDLVIYDAVQHTSNYTPGYTLPETDYLESVVTNPIFNYLYNISSLESPTITSVNSPKYIINGYAYFGGSWQASSDTYATAMTYADWQANIATFPGGQLGSGVTIKVVFQGSNTLGSVDSIAFDLNEERYVESIVTTPELEYTGLGALISFDDFTTVESGTPRYTIQIGRSGNYLYWNGAAWVVSDNTYAQANDAATFTANVSSLNVLGQMYGQFKIYFTDSLSQSYVDNLEAELTAQTYVAGDYPVESKVVLLSDSYIEFSESVVEPAGSNVGWVLKTKSGVYKYWDGAAWSTSNLSYAQSNSIADINTNKASIIAVGENYEDITVVAILSTDGSSSPQASWAQVVYSFYELEPATEISTSVIYFYIKDLLNINFSDATFYVSSKKAFLHTERLVMPIEQSADANSDGYVELEVVETATVNKKLRFKLEYTDPNDNTVKTVKFKDAIVPNQATTKGTEILIVK